MANISDIIEAFLMDMLGDNNSVNISRNELANYFSCAPSQINYVLTTRFTPSRGFVIESRRGGGGFVNVIRLEDNRDELLSLLINAPISEGLPYGRTVQILERLVESGLLDKKEAMLLATVMTDKALLAPTIAKDSLRAGMLRALATELMKKSDGASRGENKNNEGGDDNAM